MSLNDEHGDQPSPSEPYNETSWIISVTALSFLTVTASYILISISAYIIRHKSWFNLVRRADRKKQNTYLLGCCVLSLVLAVCRYAADFYMATWAWRSEYHCQTSTKISTAFYYSSIFMVYMFLWFRQSLIYRQRLLSHLVQPFTKILSNVILILMVISFVIMVPLLVFRGEGCNSETEDEYFSVFLIQSTVAIMFQVCLVILFVYPLCKQQITFAAHFSPVASVRSRHFDFNEVPVESNNSDIMELPSTSIMESIEPSETDNLTEPQRIDDDTKQTKRKQPHTSSIMESIEPSETDNLTESQGIDDGGTTNEVAAEINHNERPTLRITIDVDNTTASWKDTSKMSSKPATLVLTSKQMTPPVTPTKFDREGSGRGQGSTKSQPGHLDRNHWLRRSGRVLQRVASSSFPSNKKSITRIMAFIRKATILAVICVISDITFTIAHELVDDTELVDAVLFDTNLLICILCTILTFSDWRDMIFPFLPKKRRPVGRSLSENSVSCNSTTTMVPTTPR